jgi:O-antigen biosynthesis protein
MVSQRQQTTPSGHPPLEADRFRPAVYCLPDRHGRLDANWLASVVEMFPESAIHARSTVADAHGLQALDPPDATRNGLLTTLAGHAGEDGWLILRTGLILPEDFDRRLATLAAVEDRPDLVIFAGNHDGRVNPLAGLSTGLTAAGIDSLVNAVARKQWMPVADAPLQAALVASTGADDQTPRALQAWLVDDVYLVDPLHSLDHGRELVPGAQASLGHLRESLVELDTESITSLPLIGQDDRPVTLHVSHSWGGGISRWISDFVSADAEGHHLVLASEGRLDGLEHGQALSLYALGPGKGRIQRFVLTPAIADTATAHRQYRQIFDFVLKRYGVGRVMVSSLIGHDLYCLTRALPTAQMLHDFYPALPVLDRDPLDFVDDSGTFCMRSALEQTRDSLRFDCRDAEHWLALKTAWQQRVNDHQVQLLAPSRHVTRRWQKLFGNDLPSIRIVPHGFKSPWPETRIARRPRDNGRLTLVVVGRMSAGKGLGLLQAAIAGLQPLARIVLVGAGKNAERFFGTPGIDVILDYEMDHLPALLEQIGPDAALFLSTVPETWNYVLSEMRALGIVPIATRVGSFPERIHEGLDGLLFEPTPEDLVATIRTLAADSQRLDAMAKAAPKEPQLEASVEQYNRQVSASPGRAAHIAVPATVTTPLWAQAAAERAEQRQRIEKLEQRLERSQFELDERTDWALRQQRLVSERTRWARSLESELDSARMHVRQVQAQVVDLEQELKRRTQWAQSLDIELGEVRDRHLQTMQRLTEANSRVHKLEELVEQQRQLLEELDTTRRALDQIIHSRLWRFTRPLRVFARLARRFRNPLRWPGLMAELNNHFRNQGLQQALILIQYPPVESAAEQDDEKTRASDQVTAIDQSLADDDTLPDLPIESDSEAEGSTAADWSEAEVANEEPAESTASVIVDPEPMPPVSMSASKSPRVSVVIPVYNKVGLTSACLNSIVVAQVELPFEVIVVDDCSTDGVTDYLAGCSGIEVLRNQDNLGFIDSCNRGAAAARGEFIVFLNNDTRVEHGWLDDLIAPFQADDRIGIVGARLVYPDGRLQEAGGIIFNDASGWNYGRNQDASEPQYNFLSEADYVSGACLAIRRADFEAVSGFDTRYRPAYYEDTDLCFQMRARGKTVVCQPAVSVIHYEGASSGTDESSGMKRYQAINRSKFRDKWAEVLAGHPAAEPDFDHVDPVRAIRFRRTPRRTLVLDAVTPQPDHDSGSVRIVAMMTLLRELGYQVSFMADNRLWLEGYSSDLQHAGIEVLCAPQVASLESWLKAHGPDLELVVVSRHYVLDPVLELIRQRAPGAMLVFDTVDLHFLREEREAEITGSVQIAERARCTRAEELSLIRASDMTLVVSPIEKALLEELEPDADIRIVSNIHSIHGCRRGWAERRGLMFVGGFQHVPNVDAARWLINEIFPKVRAEIADIELHIIGSRMPDEIARMRAPGLHIHGFVRDLDPYLEGCRVSVAPLRYGAGVKGKVNQAMSHGLPVVATSCAAEGMFLQHEVDVLVADTTENFAAEIVRAHQDQALWERLSAGGLDNVEAHFSEAAARRALETIDQLVRQRSAALKAESEVESGLDSEFDSGTADSGTTDPAISVNEPAER